MVRLVFAAGYYRSAQAPYCLAENRARMRRAKVLRLSP